ncbi:MAG TPA: tripartite tricarboxylate transporter substrate-binding protein [Reyranella sp.]|nr:tripartite tricarboxylate transporter substrate-binding protein [Reyranella sp.]
MVTALLGGQLHAAFVTGIDSTAFERAGKIRHIAIGTPEPSPLFPGLPTISSEAPGFRSVSWQAIFAPKDMPDDIVARLHSTIASVIKLPTVQKVFNDLRTEAVSSTPEALAKLVSDDIALWSPVIRKANIQM